MNYASLALLVPGLPHPLICPEKNPGYQRLHSAFQKIRCLLDDKKIERLVLYSTFWPSVIGHQVQAFERPKWRHVDELFHSLGTIEYEFLIDTHLAQSIVQQSRARGLQCRSVDVPNFPIDTGSVVTLKLLNPNNERSATILSSNVYSNRAESIVFGKSIRQAIQDSQKNTAIIIISSLSNRLFSEFISPEEDHIHSEKDDEWNQKILELLSQGRLEDVAQLSRTLHEQIRVKKVVSFKPFWFLSAAMGQNNHYHGEIHAYEAIMGSGAALVSLTPKSQDASHREFDEDDVDYFSGDHEVLQSSLLRNESKNIIASNAPKPVGTYPHIRRENGFLFLSGIGPRNPKDDSIPGGPIEDLEGERLDYSIEKQTHAVIENIKIILNSAGASLEDIVDITVFLIDMKRDFKIFNQIYAEYFQHIQPTRTTLAIMALPTPIAIELKVIAKEPKHG